jgi:hypothetical protein
MFRKSPPMDQDFLEERLDRIEHQLQAVESRLPPAPPPLTDAQKLERAWRADNLSADERDFLTKAHQALRQNIKWGSELGLSWTTRLLLEKLSLRGHDATPTPQPAEELIAEAAAVTNLQEAEIKLIADAREWLSAFGDLPIEMREQLSRIIRLCFPERVRA